MPMQLTHVHALYYYLGHTYQYDGRIMNRSCLWQWSLIITDKSGGVCGWANKHAKTSHGVSRDEGGGGGAAPPYATGSLHASVGMGV